MDAVERIEISVRAALSNVIAPRHGAHWYMSKAPFGRSFDHARFIDDIKQQIGHAPADHKRRDIYIEHYYRTYSTPDMPPSWMVFESVSFGTISVAYANLAPATPDHQADAAAADTCGKDVLLSALGLFC